MVLLTLLTVEPIFSSRKYKGAYPNKQIIEFKAGITKCQTGQIILSFEYYKLIVFSDHHCISNLSTHTAPLKINI